MLRVVQTETFRRWIRKLGDREARRRILARLDAVKAGHLGDTRVLRGGVTELRIHYGPGYRLYYIRRGESIIVLLCGGDKDSQEHDLALARQLAKEV